MKLIFIILAAISIVAHRGYWKCEEAVNSENSIASLKQAQKHKLWGSECDIRLTADGKIIVNHDRKVNGQDIYKSTFDQISNMLLPNGEARPDFESYVAQAKKGVKHTILVVELKRIDNPQKEDELVQKALDILKVQKMYDPKKVMFISFSRHICEKLAAIAPEFTNQYLNGDLSPKEVKALGINGIDYEYEVFEAHPEWVAQAKELGMSVNVWTVNKEEEMRQAIAWGVDAITTNEPLLLRGILGKKEKTK